MEPATEGLRERIPKPTTIPPIEIVLPEPGEMLVLRGVSLRDAGRLAELIEERLSPRVAALRVIELQRHELTPPEDAIQALPVAVLARSLTSVACRIRGRSLASTGDLQMAYEALAEEVLQQRAQMKEWGRDVAASIQPALRSLQQATEGIAGSVAAAVRSVNLHAEQLSRVVEQAAGPLKDLGESFRLRLPDVQSFFDSLPDLDVVRQGLREAAAGQAVLEDVGYGFAPDALSLSFARRAGRGELSRRQVQAALLGLTRSEHFHDQIEAAFTASGRLQRRWRVVEAAIAAHVDRNYALSIPALLAQLEGVVTDLLIIREQAVKRGSRVFRKEAGRIKLNRKGNPTALAGLHSKTALLPTSLVAGAAADLIMDRIAPLRNGILHGTRTSYASAKLSAQLLLLLWVYGQVAGAADKEKA